MTIERQYNGTRAPMGHVVRRANHKTFLEIHHEIRSVQNQPAPPNKGVPSWLRAILVLPWPLPTLFIAFLRGMRRRDPTGPAGIVRTGGTVAVSAVDMFGQKSGWGFLPTPYSLMLIVGGIARKPAIVEDRIEPREMLSLTIIFDHDVVDGAPAARFVKRLVELIENGYGLVEIEQPVQANMSVPV
jgi:hypothetical protein